MKRLIALVGALFIAFLACPAAAAPQLRASVDSPTVEVGESFNYTLETSNDGDAPSDPQPGALAGFTVLGSGAFPSRMVSIVNGQRSDRQGLNATWSLRAEKAGTFTLGPASVNVGGARRSASAIRVTVVPRGQGRPRKPQGMDPFGPGFDPFAGMFPQMPQEEERRPVLNTDPALAMEAPRGPTAFLHATIDRTRAVVGEQVTLKVYFYEDIDAPSLQPSDIHEATANEFVKRSLLKDENHAINAGIAMVGGRPWAVRLLRKSALFPLKTGRLAIDPMSLTLPRSRIGTRESERLFVDVGEPPAAGRPPGYQIGDVGDFSLAATVTPRAIAQGGAVGVTVELRGTGNLPAQLSPPLARGIEWLEPQVKDDLGAQGERFGGTRTFSYVVRIAKEGAVDLGEIALPYYDPATRTYGVARAGLGTVDVAHGSLKDAGAETVEAPLAGLPALHRDLEGATPTTYLTERPFYWAALFGMPLACALVVAGGGAVKRVRKRRAEAKPSPDREARARRAEAEAAVGGGDGKAAMAAVIRAIEAGVLAGTRVNLRGTHGEGARAELVDAGMSAEDAGEILATLRACEDARFAPGGVTIEEARALWIRASAALDERS